MKHTLLAALVVVMIGAFAVSAQPAAASHPPAGCLVPYIQATGGFGQYANHQIVFSTGVTTGGPGDEIIIGTHNQDLLLGGAGNDVICGSLAGDRIEGGPGNDQIFGNEGGDLLFGDDDADHLDGGAGMDACIPGPGPDTHVRCEALNDVP